MKIVKEVIVHVPENNMRFFMKKVEELHADRDLYECRSFPASKDAPPGTTFVINGCPNAAGLLTLFGQTA